MSTTISKKVCLIGDFAVGKTSLIRRFVDDQFSDQYLTTVGVKISRKHLEVKLKHQKEPCDLQLFIWDLEGSTRFKAIESNYLEGAEGAIIVADLSRFETLERLPEHIQKYVSVNPQGTILVALNKSDLFELEKLERFVQVVSGYIRDWEPVVCLTSAKTGWNVDEIFQLLARRLMRQK